MSKMKTNRERHPNGEYSEKQPSGRASSCVIAMQSQTAAEKARRIAVSEQMGAEVVSIDPSVTRHGCSVGLLMDCENARRLCELMDRRNLVHGDIIGRVP